jgi:hypothetical protein
VETLELEVWDVQETFFENGWTDGLPIVAPRPELVEAMLAGYDADEVVGALPRRRRSISAQQAAVNAVMAGCRPEYFPIVLAALGALTDPAHNAEAMLTSTGGAASCLVVSGPLAAAVGMNARHNALGSGNRANATIGRAVRLVAMNVLGARSGVLDATSIGHPGRYTLCFAEDDPPAPWEPLRVQLGYERSDTTVTIMATEGPRQVANHLNEAPEAVLRTFAAATTLAATFSVGKGGQGIVVLGPEHALALRAAGWTQAEAREFLIDASRVTPEYLEAAGVVVERGSQQHAIALDADGRLPTFRSAEDLLLVTAGGEGSGWSAYLPSAAPTHHTRHATRRVRVAGEALPDCGPDSCEVPWAP